MASQFSAAMLLRVLFVFSGRWVITSTFIAIDLKSYYASVECVHRGLDPLTTNLLVANESRTDKTICLAVSPSLKAIGVSSRPRLFEAKQAIRLYEAQHHTKVNYIVAVPRMAEYERISAQIYSIYLRYVATEDIHVYSIDECFLDVTAYLSLYRKDAEAADMPMPHYMALRMIRDVIRETGITATVGIGPNLYLARGFDTIAAETVLELRETYPWIQLEMVSPWDGQANKWSDADKIRRAHLFEQADQIIYISHVYSKEVYFKRNAWMVKHCDLLLAAFDGQPGGTAMTVDYAHEHGVKVARLLPVR